MALCKLQMLFVSQSMRHFYGVGYIDQQRNAFPTYGRAGVMNKFQQRLTMLA